MRGEGPDPPSLLLQLLLQWWDLRGQRELIQLPLPPWLHWCTLPARGRPLPLAALSARGRLHCHPLRLPLYLSRGLHWHSVPGGRGYWGQVVVMVVVGGV